MNSKEALKEYKEIYIDKTFKGDCCPSQEWYLEIIEKDLEILDILFNYCYGNIKTDCYLYIDVENMYQEEMMKIKEWLAKNDK